MVWVGTFQWVWVGLKCLALAKRSGLWSVPLTSLQDGVSNCTSSTSLRREVSPNSEDESPATVKFIKMSCKYFTDGMVRSRRSIQLFYLSNTTAKVLHHKWSDNWIIHLGHIGSCRHQLCVTAVCLCCAVTAGRGGRRADCDAQQHHVRPPQVRPPGDRARLRGVRPDLSHGGGRLRGAVRWRVAHEAQRCSAVVRASKHIIFFSLPSFF